MAIVIGFASVNTSDAATPGFGSRQCVWKNHKCRAANFITFRDRCERKGSNDTECDKDEWERSIRKLMGNNIIINL